MSSKQFSLKKYVSGMRAGKRVLDDVVVIPATKKLPGRTGEIVSSLANASGGTIILGLTKKHGYTACKGFKAKKVAKALEKTCLDKLEPPIPVSVRVKKFEGSKVVIARVPEAPPEWKTCYIKRHGIHDGSYISLFDERRRRLSRGEVDEVIERRAQIDYDTQIVEGSSDSDLDMELVSGFLHREREASPYVFDRLSDEEALETMGVLVPDAEGQRRLTLAGLMALGRHPQRYFPRAGIILSVFPGSWKSTKTLALESVRKDMGRTLDDDEDALGEDVALYSKTLIGPIPVMVDEAINEVRNSMLRGSDKPDASAFLRFGDALREVIVNALMHRSYAPEDLGQQVRINVRKDRIEVISPGGLSGHVTVDNMADHGVSSSRNQFLAQILECAPWPRNSILTGHVAENRGAGFARVQAALKAQNCPEAQPVDRLTSFTVVMKTRGMASCEAVFAPADVTGSPVPQAEAVRVVGAPPEPVRKQPATDADTIMALVDKTGSVSSSEVSKLLGVSSATALRRLRELVAAGELVLDGNHGRSSRYIPRV